MMCTKFPAVRQRKSSEFGTFRATQAHDGALGAAAAMTVGGLSTDGREAPPHAPHVNEVGGLAFCGKKFRIPDMALVSGTVSDCALA